MFHNEINCLTQKINFIMEHYGAASTQVLVCMCGVYVGSDGFIFIFICIMLPESSGLSNLQRFPRYLDICMCHIHVDRYW